MNLTLTFKQTNKIYYRVYETKILAITYTKILNMQPTSKKFLEVPQVTPFALATPRAVNLVSFSLSVLSEKAKALSKHEV